MKIKLTLSLLTIISISCSTPEEKKSPLIGTWQLLSGTIVEKGDTTLTIFGKDAKMIKVINETHFSFLNHDLQHGKDSTASFVAGGGRYTLKENQYTEYLEYCSARDWEDHEFPFTVEIKNDTLIQTGIEKVPESGIERLNIEKYLRIKE